MMSQSTKIKFACGQIGSGFLSTESIGPQAASTGKLAYDSLSQEKAPYETHNEIAEKKNQMNFIRLYDAHLFGELRL